MKKFKLLFFYCIYILFFSFVYMLSFRLDISSITNIFTYKGVTLLIMVAILLLLLLIVIRYIFIKKNIIFLEIKDIFITILISILINAFILILIPTTIERSISVYMINRLNNSENGLSKSEIEQTFIDEYVYEFDAFNKRLNEQVITGNITKKVIDSEEKYVLTNKGKFTYKLFRIFNELYNIKSILLN